MQYSHGRFIMLMVSVWAATWYDTFFDMWIAQECYYYSSAWTAIASLLDFCGVLLQFYY